MFEYYYSLHHIAPFVSNLCGLNWYIKVPLAKKYLKYQQN